MKPLVNVSTFPSAKWSAEQKFGWGPIRDVTVPNIEPRHTSEYIVKKAKEFVDTLTDNDVVCILWEHGYTVAVVNLCTIRSIPCIYPVSDLGVFVQWRDYLTL